MNDILKWTIRSLISAVIWVFILSINYQGRPLFSYANQFLVQNEIVNSADSHLSAWWVKAKNALALTFKEMDEKDRETATY